MGLITFPRPQLDGIGGFQTKLALVININFVPKLNSGDDGVGRKDDLQFV